MGTDLGLGADGRRPPFTYALVKIAARCNIACKYCYWFRDPSVMTKPVVMSVATEDAFLDRLRTYLVRQGVKRFSILLHGGEPLLFGKRRFVGLCTKVKRLEQELGVQLPIAITTNGILIDREWALLFRHFGVQPTVSLDGPEKIHDRNRVGFTGKGTFAEVVRGIEVLRSVGIHPGVLTVADPNSDAREVIDFLVGMGIKSFDLLIPDENHDSPQFTSIADYYLDAFDYWSTDLAGRGIEIRLFKNMVRGLLGRASSTEGIGFGAIWFVTINTDGGIEPLDVLRIRGDRSNETGLSVHHDDLEKIWDSPTWRAALQSSITLPGACTACPYKLACGGGYLPHRWSASSGYDNPSVHCESLKQMFSTIESWLVKSLDYEEAGVPEVA